MSYLETLVDKPAIVIDIGYAYTKCGFAGEPVPHSIVPTKINNSFFLSHSSLRSIQICDYKNLLKKLNKDGVNTNCAEEDYLKEMLADFLYSVYYKILSTNSRERKVVVVESALTPVWFRKALADALFKIFQAVSVSFLPAPLASLHTLGINNGLVIDCGYLDCRAIPIAEGITMSGLCDFVNLGAKRLHEEIASMLRKHSYAMSANKKIRFDQIVPSPDLTDDILEDIKVKCCFVTTFERSCQYNIELNAKKLDYPTFENLDFKFAPDCEYALTNNITLTIPGFVREMTLEVLFNDPVDSEQTVSNLILKTILDSPIDLKRTFAQNVVLVGGTCMLNGFKRRLCGEVNNLLTNSNSKYAKELAFESLSYHTPPSLENYTAWLGGSIFGTLDVLDYYSISKTSI